MANPVRESQLVEFPASRLMVAHAGRSGIVVVYRGQTKIFENPVALRDYFFPDLPEPEILATGDEVVIIHQGVTRTYASPEDFARRIDEEQAKARFARLREAFAASPWWHRLQFVAAERPVIFLGVGVAVALLVLERLP